VHSHDWTAFVMFVGIFFMENWKDIPGYNSKYQASDMGRIRSFVISKKTGKKRYSGFMKQYCHNGYMQVKLSLNCVKERFYVHRLVALTFMPNPHKKPQVNHLNEIKNDNRLINLVWATAKENNNHGTCQQRRLNTMRLKKLIN
jgi:hypothetical protein